MIISLKKRSLLLFLLYGIFLNSWAQKLDFKLMSTDARYSFENTYSFRNKTAFNLHLDEKNLRQGPVFVYGFNPLNQIDSVLLFKGTFLNDTLVDTAKWFFENGNLQMMTVLAHGGKGGHLPNKFQKFPALIFFGTLNGAATEFYEDDKLPNVYIIENYVNGEKDGVTKTFFSSGKLMEETHFSNDKMNGEYSSWYESGQLQQHGFYLKGIKTGNWIYYQKNGIINSNENYKEGMQEDTSREYYPSGIMRELAIYHEGDFYGDQVLYDSTGKISVQKHFTYGIQDSTETRYYSSGVKKEMFHVLYSACDGTYFSWYENGKLKKTGTYANNFKTGKWKYYDKNGKLEKIIDFDHHEADEPPPISGIGIGSVDEAYDEEVMYVTQMPELPLNYIPNSIPEDQHMKFLLKYKYVDIIAVIDVNGNIFFKVVSKMKPSDEQKFLDYLKHTYAAGSPMVVNGYRLTSALSFRIMISK